jgi:hypothetical protein
MATTPAVHELSNCRLLIRPDPSPVPRLPGATVTGHVALVSRNEDAVRDVKARLNVGALSISYFWEARASSSASSEPRFMRGGSTFVSLVGGEGEQVLLVPAAGPEGADTMEASWEFSVRSLVSLDTLCAESRRSRTDSASSFRQFTLPEKGSVDFQTANVAAETGSGKARASPLPTLTSGPPPSFSSPTHTISHFVEAHLAFVGAGPEASTERLDGAGYRVAGGDLDIVERTVLEVRADDQHVEIDDSLLKGWETTLPASGLKIQVRASHRRGRARRQWLTSTPFRLNAAQVKPAHLPISASLTTPLVLEAFFHLPPLAATAPSVPPHATGEKKKSSLLATLTGSKGKEKRREEEAAQQHQQQQQQQHEGASFTIERLGGHLDIVTTGAADVRIPLTDEDVNIASQHPVLAHGLSHELHFDFAHPLEPEQAQVGSLALPGLLERTFLLTLWVKTSLVDRPQLIVERVAIPVVGAPLATDGGLPSGGGGQAGGNWDYGAPPDGPPPPMDEPPTWGAAMGEGGSTPSSRAAGTEDGPPPPGYM